MKHFLGLTAENHLVKAALLKEEKGKFSLEFVKTFFGTDSLVKQLYISMPMPKRGTVCTATALPPQDVLFRALSLPISERKKALAALPFQLEGVLPFSLDEATVAASLKPIGKEAHSVTLFATRDASLNGHLAWAQALQVEPDFVTCAPHALFRLGRWLFPREEALSIFYIGESKSCCVISIQDEICLTQTLHIGHNDFIEALFQDLPQKSRDEIVSLSQDPLFVTSQQLTLAHFQQVKERFNKELERLLYYLDSKSTTLPQLHWIVLGDKYPAFSYSSHFPNGQVRPLDDLAFPPSLIHDYAIPIGTALDAAANDQHVVQFLQGKWMTQRQKEKRKRGALRFAALCLTAACAMAWGGSGLLSKKEKVLSEQLMSYLPASLSKQAPQSNEEWEGVLWRWESSLNVQQMPFPFLSTVPSVSDVLAWLSSHPALSTPEGGKKEGIDVKSFRYQLYKHPKLGEPGGMYAAKVDLELTATMPRLAREFHDALLKGDKIVNGKKEIRWNSQQDTYWASFELNPSKKEAR